VRRFFLSQTLGDEQLSDDLAQDTFIKAYLNIDKFRGTSSFSTWLYRIAYNVYYDYVRSHKLTEDMDSAAVSRKNSEQGDSNLKMDLQQAMALLSGNERTCVVLQLMEGQSIDKIADITGIVEGSVKSYLSRGKQKLATYLRQNGYDGK
jgi:RNA polymerase sigma factor (sigma-70 family)